jgi:uncharacterized protein YbjT (DUF2867 family)
MSNDTRKTVVVAGASGFVGRALPEVFGDEYRLVGLTRQIVSSERSAEPEGYDWRRCDLFSRRQTIDAMTGANLAIYLVHSMRPSAALTQGHFRDMDLICADNFARAAARHGIEQIAYVSGILPTVDDLGADQLDEHLASRLEVEETLGNYGASVTTLRAGIVIGPGGDLTEIIFRLVERLPVMWLPEWSQSLVSPIARSDLAELVRFVLEHPEHAGQSWDVGGPDTVTYAEILELAAELLGRKRQLFDVPVVTPALSSAWISLFTGMPTAMVRPMVESLRHSTLPRDFELQQAAGQTPISLRDAMQAAIEQRSRAGKHAGADGNLGTELVRIDEPNEVRSVQRLPLPAGHHARWVAETYADWLPRFMRPFIKVTLREDHLLDFSIRLIPWPILELELDDKVSQPDRQLYWIRGGLLAGRQAGGRLEFREVLGGRWVLAAIHDFRPRLPWPLYVISQAKIHLFVMHAFARYLGRLSSRQQRIEHDPPPRLPASDTSED